MKQIIIERSFALTPFGTLAQTTEALYKGKSAIVGGEYYGIPASLACFDAALRGKNSRELVQDCAQSMNTPALNHETTLFIAALAKGDIGAVEQSCGHPDGKEHYSAILPQQAQEIAQTLGLNRATVMVVSNACTAGAAALDTARLYLTAGIFTHVVLFGFEFVSEFTVTGFASLRALSPTGALPFDKDRNGMSLGEGLACAVLSYRETVSGDSVILGSGCSNDANHRTGPSRTGDGMAVAINSALRSAHLSAEDIAAVKCHGTATPYNDAMEAKALMRIFGEQHPPTVSTKGALGHLSGGGSLLETLLSTQFLHQRMLPPTKGFCSFEGSEKIAIQNSCASFGTGSLLCLAAGFGGFNAAVIIHEVH